MDKTPYLTKEDKILASDLLFYMQNKLHVISHDDIVKICYNFYEEEHVWQEKEKYFSAIGKVSLRCRSGDKKLKYLNDILFEMRSLDDANKWQPTCVAMELSNIPQSEDGNVPNSQVLASIQSMRKDMLTKDAMDIALLSVKDELMTAISLVAISFQDWQFQAQCLLDE